MSDEGETATEVMLRMHEARERLNKTLSDSKLKAMERDYIDESLDSLTRVEFIGQGREFIRYAKDGKRFEVQIQDQGRTIKIFEVSCDTHSD